GGWSRQRFRSIRSENPALSQWQTRRHNRHIPTMSTRSTTNLFRTPGSAGFAADRRRGLIGNKLNPIRHLRFPQAWHALPRVRGPMRRTVCFMDSPATLAVVVVFFLALLGAGVSIAYVVGRKGGIASVPPHDDRKLPERYVRELEE